MAKFVMAGAVLVVGLLSVGCQQPAPPATPVALVRLTPHYVYMVEDDGLLASDNGPVKVPPGQYDPEFPVTYLDWLFRRRALYCRLMGVYEQQGRRCVVHD